MIEEQLNDLIGAVRALNDTMDEIRLDIKRMTGTSSQAAGRIDKGDAEVAAERPAEEPASSDAPPPAPKEDQPVTRDDVVAALKALDKAKGKTAVKDLLAGFEARNMTTLPKEKYGDVLAKAQEAAA